MQFELAGSEPLPDAIKHVFCLALALAVKHRIVGTWMHPTNRQNELSLAPGGPFSNRVPPVNSL
jgi:hypothetical protein